MLSTIDSIWRTIFEQQKTLGTQGSIAYSETRNTGRLRDQGSNLGHPP
jgi:hypothetical protein